MSRKAFTFEISLSVLNHLGRNLYRSFATVLGEAISNSWDADAENVWIYIDREKNSFFIKDDGAGMTAKDFQQKFLRVGYSKRVGGKTTSPEGRPYIGRKGIGKLALLSCAERVHIISKMGGKRYVGGIIDNSGLDDAITDDVTPDEYLLGKPDLSVFGSYIDKHEKGTIIYFENVKEVIRNRLNTLKKAVAYYFRFSLLDDSFHIYIDEEEVTLEDLKTLAGKTQFVWRINDFKDPYLDEYLTGLPEPAIDVDAADGVNGFIASVKKPRDLKALGTDERVSIDLFVNGRLREKDIIKHIPTSQLAENYFYGQIHFNGLDDEKDRFTTSREGIVSEDPKFKDFLDDLKRVIRKVLTDWDPLRLKHKDPGDAENERISRKKRASVGLYNAVSGEFEPEKDSLNKEKVDGWVEELKDDATFNFESYAECFVSENLIREYIRDRKFPLSEIAQREIAERKRVEAKHKKGVNINIDIRKDSGGLSYLDMSYLVRNADRPDVENTLHRDAKEYKPIRDAIAHTALITDDAKVKLTSVYNNIKGRIRRLLSGETSS